MKKQRRKKDFYILKNGKEYQAKKLRSFVDEEIVASDVYLKKTRGWKVANPAFVAAIVIEERDIVRHSFKADKMRLKNRKKLLNTKKRRSLVKEEVI